MSSLSGFVRKHIHGEVEVSKEQQNKIQRAMEDVLKLSMQLQSLSGDNPLENAVIAELIATMKHYIKMERELNELLGAVKETDVMVRRNDDSMEEMSVKTTHDENLQRIAPTNGNESWITRHPKYEQLIALLTPQTGSACDEDIAAISQEVAVTCPITKQTMKDPVKNSHCGHVYDRAAILQIIKNRRRHRVRCPVGGCSNGHVTERDLIDQPQLLQQIQRMQQDV